MAGVIKGETRSGLLYEVERLLNIAKEHNELPKYLMLENVKNLVGKKFKEQFDRWLEYLDDLGYNSYWKVLNTKDFGIPQNRERVFVISIRRDIDAKRMREDNLFEFPTPFDSGLRLKDLLETNVEEKYYLREELQDKFKQQILNKEISNDNYEQNGRVYGTEGIAPTLSARDYKDPKRIVDNNLLQVGCLKGCGLPYDKMHDQSGRVYDPEGIAPTIHCMGGGNLEPKIAEPCIAASRGRYTDDSSPTTTEQQLEVNPSGLCNTITSVQKDCLVIEPQPQILCPQRQYDEDGARSVMHTISDVCPTILATQYKSGDNQPKVIEPQEGTEVIVYDDMNDRIKADQSCVNTIMTQNCPHYNSRIIERKVTDFRIRKLTPRECWRLQGFDDSDFDKAKWYLKEEIESILLENDGYNEKLKALKKLKKTMDSEEYDEILRKLNLTKPIKFSKKQLEQFEKEERIERVSSSQLYRQAGNSITTSVLVCIFDKLFNVNPKEEISTRAVWKPDSHPYTRTYADGEVMDEHRYLMEQHIGRKLNFEEVVHHINGDKTDNKIENLMIMSRQEHNDHHLRKYPNDKVCCVCGKTFTPSKTKRKRNKLCSNECWQLFVKENNAQYKIPIIQYDKDMCVVKKWDSARDVQNELGYYESKVRISVLPCHFKQQVVIWIIPIKSVVDIIGGYWI